LNEQARIFRLMRIMACCAVARGRGAVDKLVVYFVGMAGRAKVLEGLRQELLFVRCVGIVASGAHPVLHRRVYVFHGAERLVTLGAQPGYLLRELEGLCLFLRMLRYDRLVAGIARLSRRMDILRFENGRMAFGGHAALFNRRPVCAGKAQEKQDQRNRYNRCFFHKNG